MLPSALNLARSDVTVTAMTPELRFHESILRALELPAPFAGVSGLEVDVKPFKVNPGAHSRKTGTLVWIDTVIVLSAQGYALDCRTVVCPAPLTVGSMIYIGALLPVPDEMLVI